MVARPPLPASRRAKWASDLIERLDHSQRGIVRGIKTTVEPQLDLLGDMVLDATGQKKPVDRWLDKPFAVGACARPPVGEVDPRRSCLDLPSGRLGARRSGRSTR